jgi:hypothetical protein
MYLDSFEFQNPLTAIQQFLHKYILCNVRVKSNRDRPPPWATPGNLTFEKIIDQMPARTGRNHSQMPCYRGCPGSGILAKIKLNKFSRLKRMKNRPDSSSFCSTRHIVSYIYD